ncbi:MAG: 50S ribosomal protein L32e [Nanoarchaeota archaeon]|nr:50S ribosomal protein L32e [Nanoarchaeota archaeon]
MGASRKRVKETWRKPKGMHGRVKKLLSYHKGASPDIGYASPKSIKGIHTSGLKIVEIKNISQLEKVNPKEEAIKIANVGKKKKIEIVEKALSMKIKIVNLRKPEEYLKENKKEVKK